MNDAIYQQALKDLAQAAHGAGRLAGHDGEALRDNPLCGDRVRIEIVRNAGLIAALAQETRGCLLARASASLLGLRVPGKTPQQIEAVAQALREMLSGGELAADAWPEWATFQPVRGHRSRHGCVLLPLEALLQALAA